MRLILLVLCLVELSPALAQDWPQLLGAERNGVYAGPPISTSWPEGKPEKIWSIEAGAGFAGPVIVDDRLVLFHRVDDAEELRLISTDDGAPIWTYEYPTSYRDDFGFDEGPRAAPTVADGMVFAFGAQGVLTALDFSSGKLLWAIDTHDRFRVRKGFFGAAGSPLVFDGRVLLNVGGAEAGIIALEARTGNLLWSATSDDASYSSPKAARIGDETLALFYTRSGLLIIDPKTGEVRHERRWRSRSRASVNAAVPVVVDDVVFISASYGTGALALRVDASNETGAGLEELWSSDEALSNHYATSVHHEGILYGFHGRQEYTQSFRAVELETGKVRWSREGFGAGTVTLSDGKLAIVREKEGLVVAPATPEEFRVLAEGPLLPGVIRAYPAFSNGRLYVRNERSLACFDLSRE